MPTIEELERQVKELHEAAARERREKEEERREKEEAVALAERERRARARLELLMLPSQFLDYIRNVDRNMRATFSVEPNPDKTSTGATTSVEGKFYPQSFRSWEDFPSLHATTFDSFASSFGDERLFPSPIAIDNIGRDLSPGVADEMDLRPYIRAAIEKPAATIVSKYLERIGHSEIVGIKFRNNAYGLEPANEEDIQEPPPKRPSPSKTIGVPDRWGFAIHRDGKRPHIIVAEYKAAHKLPAAKLKRVMSIPPAENFFSRAVARAVQGSESSNFVKGEVFVAKVLCQAYHYMITSGLEFGYVASGDGLVFLRVLEDKPDTLYYSWSVFPRNLPGVSAEREPRETAMAYLATLTMQAIQSTPRPASWIAARDDDLKRWPQSKATVAPLSESPPVLLPHGRDDDNDGSAGSREPRGLAISMPSRSTATQSALKRSRDSGRSSGGGDSTTHHRASTGPFVVKPPTLPYCTQACLRGLCRSMPLDTKCPNAEIHRAARVSIDSQRSQQPDGHGLTASDLQAHVISQLAENMDMDCECLDQWGCWGRYGVLFKITVTKFGYTFVAKAVQAPHRSVLQREAAVYTALESFQGRLIPVFLGIVDLSRPIPLHSCARVHHMMLLSHVGTDLCTKKELMPADIDLMYEADKTESELEAAGLRNEDVRPANLAWNEEMRCVMHFDFDQAFVLPQAQSPPSTTVQSPLTEKRTFNMYDNSQVQEAEQMAKRARGLASS